VTVRLRPRILAWVLLSLVASVGGAHARVSSDSALAGVSPHETVMTIGYGFGADRIDTTGCEYGAYWKTLIANYRVAGDSSLWILTAGPRQALRRFRPVRGRGVQVEQIDLPSAPGGYDDFLIDRSGVVLAQSLYDRADQAVFYLLRGDTVAENVVLPRKVGYNRAHGWGAANLGRLRRTGSDLYLCSPRFSCCIRIGGSHFPPRLDAADLIPGIPIRSGELVWADRLLVSRGFAPVLDLTAGPSARLEEVFDDGGFVIRRIGTNPAFEDPVREYEIYDADGALRRRIATDGPSPRFFTVGEGEVAFFTPAAVYQIEFDRKEVRLLRY